MGRMTMTSSDFVTPVAEAATGATQRLGFPSDRLEVEFGTLVRMAENGESPIGWVE